MSSRLATWLSFVPIAGVCYITYKSMTGLAPPYITINDKTKHVEICIITGLLAPERVKKDIRRLRTCVNDNKYTVEVFGPDY